MKYKKTYVQLRRIMTFTNEPYPLTESKVLLVKNESKKFYVKSTCDPNKFEKCSCLLNYSINNSINTHLIKCENIFSF